MNVFGLLSRPVRHLAIGLAVSSVPCVRAQEGVCCLTTVLQELPCQSQGCSGSVTVRQCNGGGYGTGVIWSTAVVQCCTAKISTLSSSQGQCQISGGSHPARSTTLAELVDPLVWVRDCDGAYRLLIRHPAVEPKS